MRLLFGFLALALTLAVSACASNDPSTSEPEPASTSEPDPPSTAQPPADPEPVEQPTDRDDGWRLFTYRGAEVWDRGTVESLPQTATIVEFSTTIIDDGTGPMLCGPVLDSLPPQCGGPVIDGLQMDQDWTMKAAGTRWGDRTVTVAWPPVDGKLTHVADRAYDEPPRLEDPAVRFALPEECEDIDRFTPFEQIAAWAEENPGRTGQLWTADGGRVAVLPIIGDDEDARAVREELARDRFEPCVVTVRYSLGELQAAAQLLSELPSDVRPDGFAIQEDSVSVIVDVADLANIDPILDAVDDPAIYRISGRAAIIE